MSRRSSAEGMATEPQLFAGAFHILQHRPQLRCVVFNTTMNPPTNVSTSREYSAICNQIPDVVTFRTTHDHDDTMIVFADHGMRTTVADMLDGVKPKTAGFCVGSNVCLIHHLTKSGIHS